MRNSGLKQRYKHWKETGELLYEAGRPISPRTDRELVYENGPQLLGNVDSIRGSSVSTGVLPGYQDGKDDYESFRRTLPRNLREYANGLYIPEWDYSTHRYWQLNGKPKDFTEAIGRGMYTFEKDRLWHGGSIAYNADTGEYEFMKPNSHPTRALEAAYYLSPDSKNFRKDYRLLRGMMKDKYVPVDKSFGRINIGLPEYADGADAEDPQYFENFVDRLIQREGFLPHPVDIGDGKMTLGSGLTKKRWLDLYKQRGNVWSKEDNRMAVKTELAEAQEYLRKVFSNYDELPDGAKYVLLDIQYNTGALDEKRSPKFVTAVRNGDWLAARGAMDWGNKDAKFGKGLRKRNEDRQEAWDRAFGYVPAPLALKPVSTSVKKVIPQEETVATWDGANADPYVTGKPMLNLGPSLRIPNLRLMIEDSVFSPTYSY